MANGQIVYNFGDLGDLSAGLAASVGRLDQLNAQLKQQVGQMQEHWRSQQGFEGYAAAQAAFNARLENAKAKLAGVQKSVVNASDTMAGTDRAIGQGFNTLI